MKKIFALALICFSANIFAAGFVAPIRVMPGIHQKPKETVTLVCVVDGDTYRCEKEGAKKHASHDTGYNFSKDPFKPSGTRKVLGTVKSECTFCED